MIAVRPIFIRAKNSGLNSTFTGRGAARESFSVQWGSALLRESLEFLYLSALLRGPGPELSRIIIETCTRTTYSHRRQLLFNPIRADGGYG